VWNVGNLDQGGDPGGGIDVIGDAVGWWVVAQYKPYNNVGVGGWHRLPCRGSTLISM
jgi:hypothetical protein